jgi:hypothetical protein
MSFDDELRALTLLDTAVSGAIGNRYHNDHLPDDVTYPCVRAVVLTDPSARTHDGTFGGTETVQLDVYSDTQTTRDTAADALIAYLDNYTGAMSSNWNVTIQVRNKPRSWEPESRLYRCMIELSILYLN